MWQRLATLATCNLDQWALDFEGNLRRVIESIEQARLKGASYRVGPELELTGYGCEDHFMEIDTLEHAWECLAQILTGNHTQGIVCDIGMPVMHCGVRYNCRVYLGDKKLLFIRPKLSLADDGNYRESRYFSTWKRRRTLDQFNLPPSIQELTGQRQCPFGDGVLAFRDCLLASETCEELFTPAAQNIGLALAGVEIVTNGSGSHHQLRKLDQRLELMRGATAKAGGVYLYANQRGCDGGRLYYDGAACIACNGQVLAQGRQFHLAEVEVVTATVNLDEVLSYRGAISSAQEQASAAAPYPLVQVDMRLCHTEAQAASLLPTAPLGAPHYNLPEQEIGLGPACWLWDYLRRSGASGFLLPLSGGADSSSVAAIVGCMCRQIIESVQEGDQQVVDDVRRVGQYSLDETPSSAEELAGRLLTTVYMGTVNSSTTTRGRAARLAAQIGADHLDISIDSVVAAMTALFAKFTGRAPRFRADGGTAPENLALQNIQARLRMVAAYLLAQLRPWTRDRAGFLLVLGTSNVDEGLRGYLTKYDCSSADLNPIGSVSKGDLKRFLIWAASAWGYSELAAIGQADPQAELEPLREGVSLQTDEQDMGMTYEELGVYGRLRMLSRCGPVSMFRQLLVLWRERYSPETIAKKVKHFFTYYAINRHKATTLTPSYHAETYSPDDNRFDHRPFLYNCRWPWQYRSIDAILGRLLTRKQTD
ncbi:hypothetical protein WJX73_010827 [Symbiochloris irregularis]|uniref:Glutamine-dependent NAD(+) synthetase n=1 Tax=Symbiochloris irregularis TaxID=706552 RepID=A0AAW1NP48_9CHLO